MTVYCGVDFHARKQTISYLTIEDGEVQQTELHHEQDDIRGFYAKLRNLGPVIVGFETSGYAAWFEEMLEELGCEIWIGMPAAIRRQARRRQKNDRRDADLILELMLRGDFPRLHRYTPASREVLQQLRYRHRLVKLRTIVVNSLQYMALSRGVSLRTKLLTGRGQERMKQLSLPDHLAKQRDEMCELLQELTQKIETAERWLDLKARRAGGAIANSSRHWPFDGALFGLHARAGGALCQSAQGHRLCRLRSGGRLFGRAAADWSDQQTGLAAVAVSVGGSRPGGRAH